jgi:hypothetical protein
VYADAKRNSPQSAFLRALVAFFGGILGLLLYLLLGREGHSSRGHGRRGDRHHRAWNEESEDDDSPPPSQRASLSGDDRF